MSSWQGRILSNDFWFCGEPLGFLLRAFEEFSFLFWFWNSMRIVSWLPPIPDNVTSVWSKLSIAPWMSVWVFLIDGQGNWHSIWACCVDYSFHKININPLKLIVTDTQTILFKIYHLRSSRVTMKQFSQACMKRNVFLSIMGDLKNSVTFTLNVHRFGSMRKQNLKI